MFNKNLTSLIEKRKQAIKNTMKKTLTNSKITNRYRVSGEHNKRKTTTKSTQQKLRNRGSATERTVIQKQCQY